ncbi:MAG: DNA topoisomerase 3 [Planctomycetota bacterium]
MKLLVAEKPSVARDLARFLGATSRGNGQLSGKDWVVTWAIGHLAELKPPDEYSPDLRRWQLDNLPFIPERFELRPTGDASARAQLEIVLELIRSADELVCATDAGREGELIFRYLLDLAGATERPFERLWLSSLTEEAIASAFRALRPSRDFENLHAAARSRAEADWIVGINGTRAHTVRHGRVGQGDRVLWSVGRVQTPVLALIAGRDDEIATFRAQSFFELRTVYRDVRFRFVGDRFTEREKAAEALAAITDHPFVVESVETKRERHPPPLLPDLTALQRDMNVRYGFSAAATLKIAQDLYEKKVLTYPRTDSRHLPLDMRDEIQRTLAALKSWNPGAVGRLDFAKLPIPRRVFDNDKVKDHHAIVPTGKLASGLSSEEQRVFDAVATRLVQAFLPDREEDVTVVLGQSQGWRFRARGVLVVEAGWSALEPETDKARRSKPAAKKSEGDVPDDADDDRQELPSFQIGESGPHRPEIHEGSTKPPRAYTENTLLGAMETAGKLVDDEALREALKARGLGTPATRASILETLISRGYVRREKKNLRITDLGRYLVGIVADPMLKSAELTGEWEQKLTEIEAGRLLRDEFMQAIADYARQLVRDSRRLDLSLLGPCPRCAAPIIEGRRAYGCSRWNEGCGYVLPKEYRGTSLTVRDARVLLQRGILEEPREIEESGPRILCLTAKGELLDIGVPSRAAQDASRKAPSPARSSSPRTSPPAKPSPTKRERRVEADALPNCPRCRRPLLEGERGYGCSAWREGCRFVVWKTIAGKSITRDLLATLIAKGVTRAAGGFRGENGEALRGRLRLAENGAVFEAVDESAN